MDIKFGTVDTVVGTAVREFLWSPCAGLPTASGYPMPVCESGRLGPVSAGALFHEATGLPLNVAPPRRCGESVPRR